MREKITLEKFRELKTKYFVEFERLKTAIEEREELDDFDEEKFLKEQGHDFQAVIKEILSYDLSDIPYEEWEKMAIISFDDEILDLSLTHANIDFEILEEVLASKGVNFKGCHLRNIQSADSSILYRANFDDQIIAENPRLFLSSLFDDEFEKKFVESKLEISDLISLSEEQLQELFSKNKNRYLNYQNPQNHLISDIIDKIGLQKTIRVYKMNPEYIPELYHAINFAYYHHFYLEDDVLEQLKATLRVESIPEMMDKIDDLLAKIIVTSKYKNNLTFSNRFINKNPQLFISNAELPPDVYKRYCDYTLTIEDYIKYFEVFKKGDFLNRLASYRLKELIEILGSETFLAVIAEAPFIFSEGVLPFNIENDYDFDFDRKLKSNLTSLNSEYSSKDIFYLSLIECYYGYDYNLTFAKTTDQSIYEDTKYPEWIKKLGFYLKNIHKIDEFCFDLMTKDTTITDQQEEKLINYLGLKNLLRFNKEYGLITGTHLNILSPFVDNNPEAEPPSFEEFLNRLASLIQKSITNRAYQHRYEEVESMPPEFQSRYPHLFLSADAPDELKIDFYNNEITFSSIASHPDWLTYLQDKKLETLFNRNKPMINTPEEAISLLEYLSSVNATSTTIQYISSYGSLLEDLRIDVPSLSNLTLETLDNALMEAVYKEIIGRLNSQWNLINSVYGEYLPERFKNKYPELFLSVDAPSELKTYFYAGGLTLRELSNHPEWLPYLEGKSLHNFSDLSKYVGIVNTNNEGPQMVMQSTFEKIYAKKYGTTAFLKFIMQYQSISNLFNRLVIDLKDDSKEGLEASIEDSIYNLIARNSFTYSDNLPKSFIDKHPDIFLPANAPEELKRKFYDNRLDYKDLYLHPEYLNYLKDISFAFTFRNKNNYNNQSLDIYNVLKGMENRIAYKLVSIFGNYITTDLKYIESIKNIVDIDTKTIEDFKKVISDAILQGKIYYEDDVPDFIKAEIPHMFLADDAPEELKYYYYRNSNYNISFSILKSHPEWMEYLKDKSILPFYNNSTQRNTKSIIKFINAIGGERQFLKLGLQKPKDVDYMISNNKLDLLEQWYLKTGKKFIPSYVVMITIPFEEADKFLANGKSWSTLMRSGNFGKTPEGIDALIKLAYSFGIFEGDLQAEKKLLSLISNLPRTMNSVHKNTIFQMEETILQSLSDPEKTKFNMLIGLDEYKKLREVMTKEGLDIKKGEPVLPLIYKEVDNNKYRLILNEQQYPETAKWARNFMEANNLKGMISPQVAHTLFGGFILQYDPEFREFLLKNIDEILSNPDYMTYISSIQKQFAKIQIDNSNRVLTLKLAVDYVKSNKFSNVQIGNEELAVISAIAGYTQEDFDILQQIFNYGKLRTFSSIPRISSTSAEYSYEICRLTNAFPIAAGTLSDCCQELNNCAELDMEHSMTSKHGRLFVIRDETGKIAAQSWVWRNQNVLCFDNVEIPEKAFLRAEREKNLTKDAFAKVIYDIYVKAAEELIALDEKMYKSLLEEGKITEEQYNGLRLSKVTVGLGYNDIAEAINKYAKKDPEPPKLPLRYEAPVKLTRDLYISDSRTQHILSESEGHIPISDTDTPTLYYDDYKIFDKTNITSVALQTLQFLEQKTTNRENYQLNCYINDLDNAFTELAYNYGVNEDNLKVIVTPNFATIFEETNDTIYLLDILHNNQIELNHELTDVTKEVYIQMKLALLQLAQTGKRIDASRIPRDVMQVFNVVNELSDNFDEERGISHATK